MCVWSWATFLFHICGAKNNQKSKLLSFLFQRHWKHGFLGLQTGNLKVSKTGALERNNKGWVHWGRFQAVKIEWLRKSNGSNENITRMCALCVYTHTHTYNDGEPADKHRVHIHILSTSKAMSRQGYSVSYSRFKRRRNKLHEKQNQRQSV